MNTKHSKLRNAVTRRMTALFIMFTGSALVFGMLYAMNELGDGPEKEKKTVKRELTIQKQKKKKEQAKKPQAKKVVKRADSTPRPPMPAISTPLSGLSFDIPQFATGDLMGSDKLLGAAGAEKSLVMTEDAVDSLPRPRRRVSPEYPAKARQRGIEGHVVLRLRVNEAGHVAQVRVVESSPMGIFEEVAIAAVERWEFDPALYQGAPVAISVSQKIPFRLN